MSTIGAYRILCGLCRDAGLPLPRREWEFHHTRQWKLDYAWPLNDPPLALEVEGGAWTGRGRHTRGSGFVADIEKYNELACDGWRLIRCTPDQLHKQATIELIKRALNA